MATRAELSEFLASAERRAFKQAVFAVRDEEAALDIVQDAMLKLASHYAERPTAELPLLFQRILQNTITDHFRRQKVRNTGPRCCRRCCPNPTTIPTAIRSKRSMPTAPAIRRKVPPIWPSAVRPWRSSKPRSASCRRVNARRS